MTTLMVERSPQLKELHKELKGLRIQNGSKILDSMLPQSVLLIARIQIIQYSNP